MTRTFLLLMAAGGLLGLSGCCLDGHGPGSCTNGSCAQAPENCAACEPCGAGGCQGDCGAGCADGGAPCASPNAGLGGLLGCLPCCGCLGRGGEAAEVAAPGPPVGTVTYPYYTTRGPRDFLARNPRSIGP